jgi:hypothetical protein
MDPQHTRPLVLGSQVSRDDIDDAMHHCGWRLTNIFVGSPTHPGQVVYASADRRSLLYLVEDQRLGVLYFTGTGPTIDETLAEVRDHLPVFEAADALERARHPRRAADLTEALAVLVLTAQSEPTDEQVEVMLSALSHEDGSLRNAALVAATYAAWPSLRAPIAEMAAHDPDSTVRGNAARVMEAIYPS